MSKFSVSLCRVDGIDASLSQTCGMQAKVSEAPHISANMTKIGTPFCIKLSHKVGTELSAFKIGGITCTLIYVWDTNTGGPYLEISPNLIWVYPDLEALNEVFSNTAWEIN